MEDETEDEVVCTYDDVNVGTAHARKLAISKGGESESEVAYAYAEVNRSVVLDPVLDLPKYAEVNRPAVLNPPMYADVNKTAVLTHPTIVGNVGEHQISVTSEYRGGSNDEGWVDNSFYSSAGNRGQSKPVYDSALDTEGWRINSIYSSASGSSDGNRKDGVAIGDPSEGREDNTIYVSQK